MMGFFTNAGAPSGQGTGIGQMCYDSNSNNFYVCTSNAGGGGSS